MKHIHLDADIGDDTDDPSALAMLLGWPGIELVSITTSTLTAFLGTDIPSNQYKDRANYGKGKRHPETSELCQQRERNLALFRKYCYCHPWRSGCTPDPRNTRAEP